MERVVAARVLQGAEPAIANHRIAVLVDRDRRVSKVEIIGLVVDSSTLQYSAKIARRRIDLPPLRGAPRRRPGSRQINRLRRPQCAVAIDAIENARVVEVNLESRAELRRKVGNARALLPDCPGTRK